MTSTTHTRQQFIDFALEQFDDWFYKHGEMRLSSHKKLYKRHDYTDYSIKSVKIIYNPDYDAFHVRFKVNLLWNHGGGVIDITDVIMAYVDNNGFVETREW